MNLIIETITIESKLRSGIRKYREMQTSFSKINSKHIILHYKSKTDIITEF